MEFETSSDTEVMLLGYLVYGEEVLSRLNGIFAAALWDEEKETLFLFRDRVGVKPLFYTRTKDSLVYASEIKGLLQYPGIKARVDEEGLCEIFALGPAKTYGKGVFQDVREVLPGSEIKGLLQYPGIKARVDEEGLCEIFALGPAKTYGKGVFQDVREVLPGHYLTFSHGVLQEHGYWKLESRRHEDSFEQTVEKTAWLVEDAVKKQMLSDVPISTFLSGGVDSSLVTAICCCEKTNAVRCSHQYLSVRRCGQ